jgi:fumarate reductase subunit C
MPNSWWLKKPSYVLFMLRELSSVFVALYALCMLSLLYAVSQGQASYESWIATSQSPAAVLFHLVVLVFVLYHTVTWFRISGRIFGKGALSPGIVVAANYAVWLVVSLGVVFFIVRG